MTELAALVDQYEALAERLYRRELADRSPLNVGALVDRAAAIDPRRAAVRAGDDLGQVLSYGELAERSARLAAALTERLGVARGDRVVVSLPQGHDCAIAHAAILKAGAISMPLSRMYGAQALETRLGLATPRVVICEPARAELMRAALDSADSDARLVVTGSEPAGGESLADLIAGGDPRFRPVETGRDDPALLIYTSGTTGAPKGVLHAHRVVPGHAASLGLAFNLYPRQDSVMWTPADWAWAGGLVNCLLYSWYTATTVVCSPDAPFDPERALFLMERGGVTAGFLPPTVLRRLRQALDEPVRHRLRLTGILTGSEPMDADLYGWCVEYLGVGPNEVYGQTEASAVVGNSAFLPARPGSVGRPYPGCPVVLLDDDDNPVGPGGEGEFAIDKRCESVFLRYWDDPEATEERLGGSSPWMRMGDLGAIDEDGYLWFRARRDDIITSAGYRIGPSEIEACLRRHDAVADAAVVGLPDADRGHVVAAFVELAANAAVDTEELSRDLSALVAKELAPFQRPRRIEVVDELPRTTTGKVQRSVLRARHTEKATA